MILSGSTIKSAVRGDLIGVDPEPTEDQYQPASLDVRLSGSFYRPDIDSEFHRDDNVHLEPWTRYLGSTVSEFSIPNNYTAQLAGRSTVGRKGVIIHKTAGWIDPGFNGEITFELMNLGRKPIELEVGDRIGQLIFSPLDVPSEGYDGGYQNQSGPTQAYK